MADSQNNIAQQPVRKHLSVAQYFQVIQKEYLIAEFRRKIYPHRKDKDYWSRVMRGKKKKIEEIAQRNGLESIFSDRDYMIRERGLLYDGNGNPNFEMTELDIENYYYPNSDFVFKGRVWKLQGFTESGNGVILYNEKTKERAQTLKDRTHRVL